MAADPIRINRGDEFPIRIEQSRKFAKTFYFVAADGVTAMDLTNYTGAAQVRDINGTLLMTFTVTITTPLAGRVDVTATGSVTSALIDSGYWDLYVTDSNGKLGLISNSPATLITAVTS